MIIIKIIFDKFKPPQKFETAFFIKTLSILITYNANFVQ